MPSERIEIPGGDPVRADVLLANRLGISRRRIARWIAGGHVRVDGRRLRKSTRLSGPAAAEVSYPEDDAITPMPDLEVPIVHRDDCLLALDKPAGLASVALAGGLPSVAAFVAAAAPECVAAGADPREGGLVHRLDVGTSGVIVAARDAGTWRFLREAFRRNDVSREYLALVLGRVEEPRTIDLPILAPRGRGRVRAGDLEGAREARSHVTPLETGADASLVAVRIDTGLRHQIRVHLAAAGHSVLGDDRYGSAGDRAPRPMLHAAALDLPRPDGNGRLRVAAPLPDDFRECARQNGLDAVP